MMMIVVVRSKLDDDGGCGGCGCGGDGNDDDDDADDGSHVLA